VFTPLTWFFFVLGAAAFVVELVALADAIRRPAAAFPAAGKQTKPLWLIILGVSCVVGLAAVAYQLGPINFLVIAAFVAAAIYMTDVRPKLKDIGGGSSRQGPYGPW
jgi:4-amino-4-deoxy-L-arabinose transferase-like glycosyltransferase